MAAKPWLAPWKIRKMRSQLRTTIKPAQAYTREELDDFLEKASLAADEEAGEATDVGTDVHDWIRSYIRVRPYATPEVDLSELRVGVRRSIEAFLEWERSHKVEWLASELRLGSRAHRFAGTTDFVALVDDLLAIGDFKTSKRFSLDYNIQTMGYQIALEENDPSGKYPIQGRLVVRLPKDGKKAEAAYVQTDAAEDRQEFLRRRASLRWREEHVRKKAGWLLA